MPTATDALRDALPDYRVEREAGRGAMGVVYLARHLALERDVAVKELPTALAGNPDTRERFFAEARVLAALAHPHIVPVYDFVERDGLLLLIMEALPGGTVWDRFTSHGVTMNQAVAIALATCAAMQHAHSKGVLHRDIKPENVMFDGQGALKVTDFGIARVLNGAGTKATIEGGVLGTPAYMAPEQAEGSDVTAAADVYATATMTYELMSGRLPFTGAETAAAMLNQRITADPDHLLESAPQVPRGVADVVMQGLARDPKRRFPTADQFGVALGEAACQSWGGQWLDAGGITVQGSDVISAAARTTANRAVTDTGSARVTGNGSAAATVLPPSPPGAGATIAPGQVPQPPAAKDTVVPDDPHAPRPSTEIPDVELAPSTTPSPITDRPPPAPVVKPASRSGRDVGRAVDLGDGQLIDISDVVAPPRRPLVAYGIAAVLTLALVGALWLLSSREVPANTATFAVDGVTTQRAADSDLPAVDLRDEFVVTGPIVSGDEVTMTFVSFGLPVGTLTAIATDDGAVVFKPGATRGIITGSVDAEIAVNDLNETPADATILHLTNPWYLTASGIGGIVVALFALAAIESNLRSLRRRRPKVGLYVGLILAGSVLGGALAIIGSVVFAQHYQPFVLIVAASLAAAATTALGVATTQNRARRRHRRRALRRAIAR